MQDWTKQCYVHQGVCAKPNKADSAVMQKLSMKMLTSTVSDCGLFNGDNDDSSMLKCHYKTRYLIYGVPLIIECNLHSGVIEVYVAYS